MFFSINTGSCLTAALPELTEVLSGVVAGIILNRGGIFAWISRTGASLGFICAEPVPPGYLPKKSPGQIAKGLVEKHGVRRLKFRSNPARRKYCIVSAILLTISVVVK